MSRVQALWWAVSPARSIRTRLVLIVLAVEVFTLSLMTLNDLRLLTVSMTSQAEQYVEGQAPVLSAAVLAPLLQRDYATIQSILDEGRGHASLIYLAVRNSEGVEIAASGVPPETAANAAGRLVLSPFGPRGTRYDVSIPIEMWANRLGSLHIGLDIRNIWQAVDQFLVEGLQILLLGLVVSTCLLLGLLHMTVTRHMTALTQGINELERGNYQHRFTRQSADELGALATALNYMSGSVSQAFETLRQSKIDEEERLSIKVEQRTEALNQSNQQLQSALDELKTAQSQLVQSEKLATLGQIVANVAHEINTPIGAVKSSGESISVALNRVLAGFPALVLSLDEATRNLFFALVIEVRKPAEPLSTREERALNRAVRAELEAADMPDAQTKADWLLGLKVRQQPMRFVALLQHPRAGDIFEMANQIATIIHSADNINLAVERVAKIIFALKSFAHTDASGEFQPVDLKAGMETVLTIYSNQIKQGVEVTREYGDVGPVECLPDELNQVWTNLIHNALQAMQNSGTLTVKVAAQDGGVVVSIADNGPGIPEDIRGRIFDPFFTTKPVGEGSGLGLDIARKIVDKHHGRLELHSEVGVGTTFSVWLPLQQAT